MIHNIVIMCVSFERRFIGSNKHLEHGTLNLALIFWNLALCPPRPTHPYSFSEIHRPLFIYLFSLVTLMSRPILSSIRISWKPKKRKKSSQAHFILCSIVFLQLPPRTYLLRLTTLDSFKGSEVRREDTMRAIKKGTTCRLYLQVQPSRAITIHHALVNNKHIKSNLNQQGNVY